LKTSSLGGFSENIVEAGTPMLRSKSAVSVENSLKIAGY